MLYLHLRTQLLIKYSCRSNSQSSIDHLVIAEVPISPPHILTNFLLQSAFIKSGFNTFTAEKGHENRTDIWPIETPQGFVILLHIKLV